MWMGWKKNTYLIMIFYIIYSQISRYLLNELYFTHNIGVIHKYTRSKWNFWLKVSSTTKICFWNHSMREEGEFCSWICNFGQNPPFSEISQWFRKWFATRRKFQNKFFVVYVSLKKYMITTTLFELVEKLSRGIKKQIELGTYVQSLQILVA